MNNTQNLNQSSQNINLQKQDEEVLVVKRNKLFEAEAWQGLKEVDFDQYLNLINTEKEFLARSIAEEDIRYKQIIPYLVFSHDDQYFLMQRKSTSTEQRLKNKFSLGIGGHIRIEDLVHNDIFKWAEREFEEEVDFSGQYTIQPLGILNDDSNPVGQVHVGFVFLLKGNSANIKVKDELKSGELLTLDEAALYYDLMEKWTQIVFDFIKAKNS